MECSLILNISIMFQNFESLNPVFENIQYLGLVVLVNTSAAFKNF